MYPRTRSVVEVGVSSPKDADVVGSFPKSRPKWRVPLHRSVNGSLRTGAEFRVPASQAPKREVARSVISRVPFCGDETEMSTWVCALPLFPMFGRSLVASAIGKQIG